MLGIEEMEECTPSISSMSVHETEPTTSCWYMENSTHLLTINRNKAEVDNI